jgi:hypothetical protein
MIHINAESANPETLVQELKALGCTDWSALLSHALTRIAADHKQDCIAVRFSPNTGITVGSKPVSFNEEYFNVA